MDYCNRAPYLDDNDMITGGGPVVDVLSLR